jgi:carbon monoxide dehydrogenase subunit G
MVRAEEHITINRPIEEVFAYLSDIERQAEWVSTLSESQKTTSGPTEAGTTYRQVVKVLGRRVESENEVTDYQPPTLFAFRGKSGPMRMGMRFTLTSAGPETTEVTQVAEGASGGVFKLADPMLAPTMKKQFAADLETLKTMLESGIATEAVTR